MIVVSLLKWVLTAAREPAASNLGDRKSCCRPSELSFHTIINRFGSENVSDGTMNLQYDTVAVVKVTFSFIRSNMEQSVGGQQLSITYRNSEDGGGSR